MSINMATVLNLAGGPMNDVSTYSVHR